MNPTLGKWMDITFALILVYLVATNAPGISQVTKAFSGAYSDSVRALQGK